MIWSFVLGALISWTSNSMYFVAFDVLIKILEVLSTSEPKKYLNYLNRVTIFGVTVHWIEDIWNLHERVLAVEELRESHGCAHMTKSVAWSTHRLQFDRQDENYLIFFYFWIIFCTKYLFSLFLFIAVNKCNW